MDASINQNRELLIREVRYRCSYRSTLELDMVCRSLLPHLETLETDELDAIRNLLLNKEGDLMSWLVEGQTPPPAWALTVGLVRHYFKLYQHAPKAS